jgi:hypothetical protein
MAEMDNPGGGGGDWFDQNQPPASDPFTDQLTALYAKYGRGAPTQAEINAHRGNPGGLAAVEQLLIKDNAAAAPKPAAPAPAGNPAPAGPSLSQIEQPQTYGPGGPTNAATTNYGDPLAGKYPDIYVSGSAGPAPTPPPDMAPYVPKTWDQTAPTATKLAQYRPPTAEELKATPGYMARLDAQDRAFQRSAAAQGSVLNGGTVRAAGEAAQTFASNEYDNSVRQGLAITGANNAATSGDNSNAYEKYVADYGAFSDSENRALAARNQNFGEQQAGFANRYRSFLDANSQSLSDYLTNISTRRNTANDYWSHLTDLYGPGANLAGNSYKPGPQL